jgi:hypothetical protein
MRNLKAKQDHVTDAAMALLYKRWGDDMNEGAISFRNRLSELAGEKFG